MVLDEAYDMGLYIPGSPYVELMVDQPQVEVFVTNGNYGTHLPIEITAIQEAENPTGVPYLVMDHANLPAVVNAGESFVITLTPNTLICKGTVSTMVTVHSNNQDVSFYVIIDESLLVGVTEVSAETKLYPNPTEGLFTVEGANVAKVEVFNLVGQKVHEAEGQTINIDATAWNKGIYLVNIKERNGAIVTKKLVVK